MNADRPRTVAALAAGFALAVLVPEVAVAAPGDPPGTALDAAISGLRGQGYNLSAEVGSTASGGTGSVSATGAVDPAANAAEADFKSVEGGQPVEIHFVQTPDALYAMIDIKPIQTQLGVGPDQWVKVDQSKVKDKSNLPFDLSGSTDAINISGLMTSVDHVAYPNPGDPTRITGTVDLTAATGVGAPDPNDLKQAGSAATTTPFTATLDRQGRLAELKIDADGFDGNLSQDLNFSDYGTPRAVSVPPPSAVIPAPAPVYLLFKN